MLPQFVFADIDAAAPRHGDTTWLDMHFPERRQILQRLEKRRGEERFDVIVFDDAIVERDAKPMIIQRLNSNDPRRPNLIAYSNGGIAWKSCVSQIRLKAFWFSVAHSTTSFAAVRGRSPSITSSVSISYSA